MKSMSLDEIEPDPEFEDLGEEIERKVKMLIEEFF